MLEFLASTASDSSSSSLLFLLNVEAVSQSVQAKYTKVNDVRSRPHLFALRDLNILIGRISAILST